MTALEEKLNEAICKFGEDGVYLKLNTQGVKDVILDQSDADHITSMQVCSYDTLFTLPILTLAYSFAFVRFIYC